MKRLSAVILALILALSTVPFGTFAEDSVERYSGDNALFVCDGADEIVIGGKNFKFSGDSLEFTVTVVTDDASSKYNAFYLNGNKIGVIQHKDLDKKEQRKVEANADTLFISKSEDRLTQSKIIYFHSFSLHWIVSIEKCNF